MITDHRFTPHPAAPVVCGYKTGGRDPLLDIDETCSQPEAMHEGSETKEPACVNCGYENCQCDANADAIHTIREITDAHGGESIPFIDDAVKHCITVAEERGRQELHDRLLHLASGIRKGGNKDIAEMIEITVRGADKGTPLVKLLAAERDRAEERRRLAVKEVGAIADELERVMYEVIGCGNEGSEKITPSLKAVLSSLRALTQ